MEINTKKSNKNRCIARKVHKGIVPAILGTVLGVFLLAYCISGVFLALGDYFAWNALVHLGHVTHHGTIFGGMLSEKGKYLLNILFGLLTVGLSISGAFISCRRSRFKADNMGLNPQTGWTVHRILGSYAYLKMSALLVGVSYGMSSLATSVFFFLGSDLGEISRAVHRAEFLSFSPTVKLTWHLIGGTLLSLFSASGALMRLPTQNKAKLRRTR